MGGRAIESDHNTEFLELRLQFEEKKKERQEIFNFKDKDCQNLFLNLTSQTDKFTECFDNNLKFEEKTSKWKKTLTEFCHKSFTKIRITDYKPKVTKISELMEDRKSLKQMLAMCEDAFSCAKYQIYEIDEMIASECSEENYLKIMENFGKIGHQQDCMYTTGMWGVLTKSFP